jgi:hypothetical protein
MMANLFTQKKEYLVRRHYEKYILLFQKSPFFQKIIKKGFLAMPKFKIGDMVVYKNNNDEFKLGLIQKVYERKCWTKNLFNEIVPFLKTISYQVWFFDDEFHKISEKNLYSIENIFNVYEFISKKEFGDSQKSKHTKNI